MFKNVIKEIQQKPPANLTVVCARPGDGKRAFTIELANDFAMKGVLVCYCSITRTKANLEKKLLPGVYILSAFPKNESYAFKRLTESARARNAVVLIDDLSSFVLEEGLKQAPLGEYDKAKIKTELLLKIKEIAIQRELRVIVADGFSYASDTDDLLPIPWEGLALCDSAYILYKDDITADNVKDPDIGVLKLKTIKEVQKKQ